MPKKDTNAAVLGMLSTVGERTRPLAAEPEQAPAPPAAVVETPAPIAESPAPVAPAPVAAAPEPQQSATVSTLPGPATAQAEQKAPRTLRLQPGTAHALRDAWLEAKRDDVLLTAQDFASALIEEALARRRHQRAAAAR